MKSDIFGRTLLLALMVAISACSYDSMIGMSPRPIPPIVKATVDPVPQPVVKPEAENSEPARQQLPQTVPVAPKVEEQPQAPTAAPPIAKPAAPAVAPLNERVADVSATPDREYRNETVREDTVWHGEVHVNGWLTVPPQVTLTIEAGTIVRFIPSGDGDSATSGLLVQGRMVAAGAPDKQILFAGRYAQPAAGDWQGIVFLASEKKNLLDQCRIEGARVGLDVFHSQIALRELSLSASGTAIRLQDSDANIAGGVVSSCDIAVKSVESELDLRDINISSNRNGIMVSGGAFYLTGATFYGNSSAALVAENCKLKVSGCSFTVNGTGVVLTGSEGTVSFNRMLSNREAGVNLTNSRIRINGNNISQNGSTGLKISGAGSVAWGNVIAANNGHDLEYSGDEDLSVMGNWWGDIMPDRILSRIRRGDSNGRVLFMPVLPQRPQAVL